jgi:GT2 family glycosyltransferase
LDAIVVTHNSRDELERLLASPSVRAAFARLIVVDNASTDGTPTLARCSGVEVVGRSVNDGFGAGVNAGTERVTSETFAVLNPDIAFVTLAMERVLMHFEDPRVGIVAPSLRLPDGRLQDSVRDFPSPGDLVARRLVHSQARRGTIELDRIANVPWAVAACWFVDRGWFDRLGGFDERYFLYFEDVDFCVRLAAQGGIVRFDPGLVVEHRHRADSRRSMFGWANRRHIRSAARFFMVHPRYLLRSRWRG